MADPGSKSMNDLAVERTDLAVERTIMAANRTLMAWVRTGLSLISFGFTIYKFLQASIKAETAQQIFLKVQSPRRFGLTLIALGTLSVILGAIEYVMTVKGLNKFSERKHKPFNYSFIVAIVIGLLGLILFVTIATHTDVF